MTWERYANPTETGIELEVSSGRIFTPRFYCCNNIGGPIQLYTTKPPVCHLSLTPRVQILGEPIAWSIGDSYSSTETIDAFWVDWGGATDIGNLSGEDFLTDPTSGDVVYDAVGRYTVTAYVRDVLGTDSQPVSITVEIVEPAETIYIGSTDAGAFRSIDGSEPAHASSGLSGEDLKLRAIRLNPHYADLPQAQHHVWICCKTGLAYSTDGAATWTKISEAALGTPSNTAGDDPAPATADLDQIDLCFDPQDNRRLYLLRTTATRAWLYTSSDYGTSWSNTQVSI